MKMASFKEQAVAANVPELQRQLDTKLRQMGSWQKGLQGVRLNSPFERGFEAQQRKVAGIVQQMRTARQKVDALNRQFSELKQFDSVFSDIGVTRQQCEQILRKQAELLQQWEASQHERVQGEFQALNKALAAVRRQGDGLQGVKNIRKEFADFFGRLQHLLEGCQKQAEDDRQRRLSRLQNMQQQGDALVLDMQGLVTESEVLRTRLEEEPPGSAGIARVFAAYGERLQQEGERMQADLRSMQRIQWPAATDDAWLAATQKKITEIHKHATQMRALLAEIRRESRRLQEVDMQIATQKESLRDILDTVQPADEVLQRWLPDDYAAALEEHRRISAELDLKEDTLRSAHLEDGLQQTAQGIAALAQHVEELLQEMQRREEKHQQRLYILKALHGVCHELNFKEATEPAFMTAGDYNSSITQTFDTRTKGQITFTLPLHDEIQSESGIQVGTCEDEFGRLSDLLKEQFGVQTAFTRIGDDGKPIRKTSTEKPLPQHDEMTRREFVHGS